MKHCCHVSTTVKQNSNVSGCSWDTQKRRHHQKRTQSLRTPKRHITSKGFSDTYTQRVRTISHRAQKDAFGLKGIFAQVDLNDSSCCACCEKLKVPPRPFPLEELSHYNHSGQLQVFFTQLEPNVHGVRQSSHVSVETNSNKRISVLGTNHTKIYRVNLVGFKHRAEDPARSPHKQSKYTLRSKRFSNVLTNHQGRFPKPWDRQDSQLNLETVPEAKPLTNRGTFHKRLTLMILHPPHFAEGFLKDLRRDQQKTNSGPSALGGCPGHIPLVRTRHSSTRPPNTTQRRSLIKRACRF